MKAMILAIAVVMAATGCETTKQKLAKGYVQDPAGNWVRGDRPYFGDGKPKAAPGQFAFDPTVFNQAMAQNYGGGGGNAPQPIIVTGPGSGTTMASQVGNTTIVSQFGGYRPIARQPMPIIDTSGTPIYYTEPIRQP